MTGSFDLRAVLDAVFSKYLLSNPPTFEGFTNFSDILSFQGDSTLLWDTKSHLVAQAEKLSAEDVARIELDFATPV